MLLEGIWSTAGLDNDFTTGLTEAVGGTKAGGVDFVGCMGDPVIGLAAL